MLVYAKRLCGYVSLCNKAVWELNHEQRPAGNCVSDRSDT